MSLFHHFYYKHTIVVNHSVMTCIHIYRIKCYIPAVVIVICTMQFYHFRHLWLTDIDFGKYVETVFSDLRLSTMKCYCINLKFIIFMMEVSIFSNLIWLIDRKLVKLDVLCPIAGLLLLVFSRSSFIFITY
jgi:hypothetical protein